MRNLTYDDVNQLKARIMEVLFEFEQQFDNVEAHISTGTVSVDSNCGSYQERQIHVTVHHKIESK